MNIPQSYHGKPLIHAWTYCAKDGAPFGAVARYQDGDGKKEVVPCWRRLKIDHPYRLKIDQG